MKSKNVGLWEIGQLSSCPGPGRGEIRRPKITVAVGGLAYSGKTTFEEAKFIPKSNGKSKHVIA